MLNASCQDICAHYEQREHALLSTDMSLRVSVDHFREYLDVQTGPCSTYLEAGFGVPYNGVSNFTVTGQIAVQINIIDSMISLTELIPKLKNSAARDIPRTAVYSKHVENLIYFCWEILLGSPQSLNYNQVVYFHDIISNHEGLQCQHVGKAQQPLNCESCNAR